MEKEIKIVLVKDDEEEDKIGTSDVKPGDIETGTPSKKFCWKYADEIEFLKEVQVVEPYLLKFGQVGKAWTSIAEKFKKYTAQTAQKHFNLLMKEFKKKQAIELKTSGEEEFLDQKDMLLEGILERMDSEKIVKGMKEKVKREEKDGRDRGLHNRDSAAKKLKLSPKAEPIPKKSKEDKLLEIMEKKNELEERRLNLEEKKHEMLMDLIKNNK